MILVTGATRDVGRHIASRLLRTSAAVRSSTCGADSTGPPGCVVDGLEHHPDQATVRIAAKVAA